MEQQIIFSNDIPQSLNTALGGLDYNKTVIITDVNTRQFVFPKIADVPVVKESPCIVINSGDINKTVETAATVWKQLETAAATRRTVVINIGGGVVTDLGDAAIGGKTGVNFGGLKNEIGVFNEACAVVVSTLFFDTLPPTELKSGYAEMLKHGLLSDRQYFADLLGYDITASDRDTLLGLLKRSVMIKRDIVAADPHEHGLRRALNLGHTAGHAFESLAMKRMKPVPHGYAVAWGLVVELILSHLIYKFPSDILYTVAHYVGDNYGTFTITCDDYDTLIALMRHDKKSRGGEINCSLLADVGEMRLGTDVSTDDAKAALDIYRDLLQ